MFGDRIADVGWLLSCGGHLPCHCRGSDSGMRDGPRACHDSGRRAALRSWGRGVHTVSALQATRRCDGTSVRNESTSLAVVAKQVFVQSLVVVCAVLHLTGRFCGVLSGLAAVLITPPHVTSVR